MIRFPSTSRSRIRGYDDHDIHEHVRFGPCHSHAATLWGADGGFDSSSATRAWEGDT
jgi:hypothetical protein